MTRKFIDPRDDLSVFSALKASRERRRNVTQRLADTNLLTCVHAEREVLRRLEDEYDGAAEAEPAHLLRLEQRLPVEYG